MTDKTKKPIITVKDVDDADALEIALFKWRIGVCAGTNGTASKDVLDLIRQRGAIKPKDAARAAILFKDTIEVTDDWWTLYVACKCGAIEDDTKARGTFDSALALGWGTSLLKEKITEAKANAAPRKPSPGEQVVDILRGKGQDFDKLELIASLPFVTKEIERRAALAKREVTK